MVSRNFRVEFGWPSEEYLPDLLALAHVMGFDFDKPTDDVLIRRLFHDIGQSAYGRAADLRRDMEEQAERERSES